MAVHNSSVAPDGICQAVKRELKEWVKIPKIMLSEVFPVKLVQMVSS